MLAHAEVRFAAVEDQEQVDKILSVSDRLPKLETDGLRRAARACATTTTPSCTPIDEVIADGRKALAEDRDAGAAGSTARSRRARAPTPRSSSTPPAPPGSPRAWCSRPSAASRAGSDTVAFDKLTEKDEALAYLPLAWVGDHYLNYAQGLVAGFCMACPESGDTAMADLREIGPTFFFAPPRTFEQMLTRVMIRMEDASFLKRQLFHYFIGVARRYGEAILNKQPVPLHGRLLYWLGNVLVYAPLKNVLGLSNVRIAYTAGEAIGPDLFSFYRSLGLNLKQLYGQTEAFLYLTAQPDGQIYSDTVGPGAAERRPAHRRQRRGAVQVARHVRQLLQGRGQDQGDDDAGRLRQDRRRRLLRLQDRAPRRSSTAPRMSASSRTARCSRRNTSRTS